MHYEGLAIICSNVFSNYEVNYIKPVAYSQVFDHVHVYGVCV